MAGWNEFETIEAPGPKGGSKIRLTVSQEFIDKHLAVNRLTPLFQISAHIYGRLPDINLISQVENAIPTTEMTTLDNAIACFEGVERPHDDEKNGDTVLVYVMRPAVTIERVKSMAEVVHYLHFIAVFWPAIARCFQRWCLIDDLVLRGGRRNSDQWLR